MIHFKKLRLSGFKSFVDPTELLIEPGMTGVVGPNGCGKSNLVEALRWVMGETSAKQMRGGDMDDVIFGGTSHRPARSHAEVTAVLDNRLKTAPTLFNAVDEIEIARRIVRGEGSVYRFNGKEVRAKDVQLLFADMATGARSTAMVSQGRVGMLINAKPAQRRSLLEEAAGISGLYTRRHEAELRLKAAETNLQRLEDVLGALDAQLTSLRRQVKQAQRYRTLSENIRTTEAMLLTVRWAAAAYALEEARTRHRQAELDVAARTGEAAAASREHALASHDLPALRQAEAEASAALQRVVIAREHLDAEERRIADVRAQADRHLRQIADDREREKANAADAQAAMTRLEEERCDLDAGTAEEGEALELARARVEELHLQVEEQDAEVTALTERAAAFEAARASAAKRVQETQVRVERMERRLAEAEAAVAAARNDVGDGADVAAAEERALELEERLDSLRLEIEDAEGRSKDCRARVDAARDHVQELAAHRARLRAEIQALENVLAAVTDGDGPPVLDKVGVDPGYELALGAALGEELSAPLSEDAPQAVQQWRLLPPLKDAPTLPSGVSPLVEAVRAPPALGRALAAVGVVETSERGDALRHDLWQGQTLVSRDGAVWRWDGLTRRAGAPSSAAQRLKEKNRLDGLRLDLKDAEDRVAEAEAILDTARQEAEAITVKAENAKAALRSVETDLNAARTAYADLVRRIDAAETRLSAASEQATSAAADLVEARTAAEEARAVQSATTSAEDLRAQADRRRAILAESRATLAEARSTFDRVARDAEERRRRLIQIREDEDRWRQRRERAEAQCLELDARHREAMEEIELLAERPLEIAEERAMLQAKIEEGEETRRQAADRLAEAEERARSADIAARETEKAAAAARERLVRAEAAVEQGEQLLEQTAGQIRERLDCTPQQAKEMAGLSEGVGLENGSETANPSAPPSLEEVDARLHRLIRERESMGPVNLRAEQETAELEEQAGTLGSERDDLTAAIARLRQGVSELNREGRQRLLASFEQVDTHFRRLFVRLFGGGRAHLALVESDDPLEAGLEIFASPPGKRLQILSLLSGGEQAMTALALLFAVFLVNPAPICVLDEVDAPLDDANVDRFCTMLDELTRLTDEADGRGTRFLVVTHHRMTMARMDRLFGVTMQERGVSRLVSVDLREAEALTETALPV